MIKELYVCDVCGAEAKEKMPRNELQVIFLHKDSKKKSTKKIKKTKCLKTKCLKKRLALEVVDTCKDCLSNVLDGNLLFLYLDGDKRVFRFKD